MRRSLFEANKNSILKACAAKTLKVEGLPVYYHVHLNMPCNQRCIMCVPNGQHAKDILPWETFMDIFEKIKPYAEHLTLIGGEPLIYPWISEVLELLSHQEIAVSINTNATMLREKIVSQLLALPELYLRCSIDAATPETYFRIRGTDFFGAVCANLRRFAEAIHSAPHLRMILIYVVMRENLHEVIPFIELAKGFVPCKIEFHPVRHVADWHVTNLTGWVFDGREQSCEFFKEEYNETMRKAEAMCESEGFLHEVQFL
jgi:MoaA/NifB/PqqE/SkfB family radical SAM enzyme